MSVQIASVHGWEIHRREDRGFGVYDSHGLIAGPFGTREAAINAALLLPRHRPSPSLLAQAEQRPA